HTPPTVPLAPGATDHLTDQARCVCLRQPLEAQDRSRPARPCIERLRTRETDNQQRGTRKLVELLHEVEQRLLCPMQIVDCDDEWPVARKRLEGPPCGPGDPA